MLVNPSDELLGCWRWAFEVEDEGVDLQSLFVFHSVAPSDDSSITGSLLKQRLNCTNPPDVGCCQERAKGAKPAQPADCGRPSKGTNVVPLSKGGNDRLTARIARDHPGILERMKRGEFTSVLCCFNRFRMSRLQISGGWQKLFDALL